MTLVLIKNEVIVKSVIDLGLNVIQYYSTQCCTVSPVGKYFQMLPEGLLLHQLFHQIGLYVLLVICALTALLMTCHNNNNGIHHDCHIPGFFDIEFI